MWECSVRNRHPNKIFSGISETFSECPRHFTCAAKSDTNDTVPITNNRKGIETGRSPPFTNSHDTVDCNHVFLKFKVVKIDFFFEQKKLLSGVSTVYRRCIDKICSGCGNRIRLARQLELQSLFSGSFCESFYAPVIEMPAPVKDSNLNLLMLGFLSEKCPDALCCFYVTARLRVFLSTLVTRWRLQQLLRQVHH